MDELEELRQANPVSVEDARELVAMDRREVVDAVAEVAGGDSGTPPTSGPATRLRMPSTKALVGGLAAACLVAFMAFTITDQVEDRRVIEASVLAPSPNDGEPILVDSIDRGFDRSSDLLVVHFDFVDRGDGHAAVAAREVATWFDVEPVVVAGTQRLDADRDVHGYAAMMDAAWEDLWLDAGADRPEALDASVRMWLDALDAGGRIWVAEGGVSDFTAEVVEEVGRQRPNVNTQSVIHVIQQSETSENDTGAGDLAFVQAKTAYRRIGAGDVANGTADLDGSSDVFETSVLSGCHQQRWEAAFRYLPAADLRFPDGVPLLHIVAVDTTEVADVEDFASYFIGDQPDAKMRGGA